VYRFRPIYVSSKEEGDRRRHMSCGSVLGLNVDDRTERCRLRLRSDTSQQRVGLNMIPSARAIRQRERERELLCREGTGV